MAAQIKDAITLWGVGQSMEPLYAANTAVVVAPIKYDNVKKGMTVVYVKRNGRRVAHSVIGETRVLPQSLTAMYQRLRKVADTFFPAKTRGASHS